MKLAIEILGMFLMVAEVSQAQTTANSNPVGTEAPASVPEVSEHDYTVFGATSIQEAALRAEIQQMHPEVLPLRVFFVPHWKYLDNARVFQLHVPTGFGSLMFTHLPSRTVFIDNDRYQGEEWLVYWLAHELGHLKTNSPKEVDAEKAAREFRKRFEDGRKGARLTVGVAEAKRQGS